MDKSIFECLNGLGVRPVLTFEVARVPELVRSPSGDDAHGADLTLHLKYEGEKGFRWSGRAAMDDSRQVDALGRIKEGETVMIRFGRDQVLDSEGPERKCKNADGQLERVKAAAAAAAAAEGEEKAKALAELVDLVKNLPVNEAVQPNASLLIQVGSHRWALPGLLSYPSKAS